METIDWKTTLIESALTFAVTMLAVLAALVISKRLG